MLPDREYKICLESVPICTVDLVIFDPKKEKTLLFLRNNKPAKGLYYTLGGRVFKNESPEEALKRIALAEADLNVDSTKLKFGGYINEVFEDSRYGGVNSHCINLYFVYFLGKDEDINLDDQHGGYKWFKMRDVDEDGSMHKFAKAKIMNHL